MISHDREFMDQVVENVYEIAEQKLTAYSGNYSAFLKQREANYEQQAAAYKNQQKEIASLREFYDRFRSVASKASQAMSKLKQIERLELIEKPVPPRKPFRFQIPQPPRGGQRAISLESIDMAYGKHQVYTGLDLSIERGERTGARRAQRSGQIDPAQDSGWRRGVPTAASASSGTTRRSATSASTAPRRSARTKPCSKKSWTARPTFARTRRAASSGRSCSARTRFTRKPPC